MRVLPPARLAALVGAGVACLALTAGAVVSVGLPASADVSPAANPSQVAAPSAGGQAPVTGDARWYTASVTAIEPAVPGLGIRVLDSQGSITLDNRTGKAVEVLGYAGERFLRFTDDGVVLRNSASLTAALTQGLTPTAAAGGAGAGGKEQISWQHVAHGGSFTWADSRVRWSPTERPPVVAADEHSPHRVLDWAFPVTVDGRRTLVRGTVEWIGTPRPPAAAATSFTWAVVAGLLMVTLAALVVTLVRRPARRRARTAATVDGDGDGPGRLAADVRAQLPVPDAGHVGPGGLPAGDLVLTGRPPAPRRGRREH
jgi:hypothetical protein